MILNSAPANEAVLSNVGTVSSFTIKATAKSFRILSDVLYANKIRAIIRELSCNAYDSHVAAGRKDLPFDIHLPTLLEPFFAIRDYGVGLDHNQVTNIFTTFFESTKTDSNDYVGALGLGSKSPFSYTDNFTVTAIKNGRKGVYTAFINEVGVPSIALMMEEDTTEATGVEVQFGVESQLDFNRFYAEAKEVFAHFTTRPNILGVTLEIPVIEYETRDVIPGVHVYKSKKPSVAVMGNIAYPINVPSAKTTLGSLAFLLDCSLELHFEIGELDFQASREGLSYVSQTINAIQSKLEKVNAVLQDYIKQEAEQIENLWDRAEFLVQKSTIKLWNKAVEDYVLQANLITCQKSTYGQIIFQKFSFTDETLAKQWNIRLRKFYFQRHYSNGLSEVPKSKTTKLIDGVSQIEASHLIESNKNSLFVVNDTKTGGATRLKYHVNQTKYDKLSYTFYLLEKADRSRNMDLDGFFAAIHQPPVDIRTVLSSMKEPEKKTSNREVSILMLTTRDSGGWTKRDDLVWREAGTTSSFSDAETYYYVPLNGYTFLSKNYNSAVELFEDAKCIPGFVDATLYGVRKKDIEEIKKMPNWKNFEEHVEEMLKSMDIEILLLDLIKSQLSHARILNYDMKKISSELPAGENHEFVQFVNKFSKCSPKGREYIRHPRIIRLLDTFLPHANISSEALKEKYQTQLNALNQRYPLLRFLEHSSAIDAKEISDYINMCDAKKGV